MLAKRHRIIEKEDFSYIIRVGVKKKLKFCIVYLVLYESHERFFSQAGFIVSKKVGNAVTRNSVKRRLREIIAEFYGDRLKSSPLVFNVVIRALPSSAQCTYEEMRVPIHSFLSEFD